MSVAMNERKMAMRVIAREETGRGAEKLLIQIAPLAWQPVTEPIGKGLELDFKSLHELVDGIAVEPRSNRNAKARIIPPFCVEPRERLQHALALLHCWRQRPSRSDDV